HGGRVAGGHGDRRHAVERCLGCAEPQPPGPRRAPRARRSRPRSGSARGGRPGNGSGTARGSRSEPVNTRLTLAAAVATVLASTALCPLLDSGGWFWTGIGAAIVVAAVGAATRRRAIPAVLCFLAAVGALFLYLNVVFAGRQSWAGLAPTAASLQHLR